MQIQAFKATIITEKGQRRINRSVARQFPIRDGKSRAYNLEQGEFVPSGICKIMGKVLGKKSIQWLYLVEDPMSGYAWVPAHTPYKELADWIASQGGSVDDPLLVPTVVL